MKRRIEAWLEQHHVGQFLFDNEDVAFIYDEAAPPTPISLSLRPEDISFAPIYDVVPLFLYPEIEQELAMKIGGARRSQEVTPAHWRKLAQNISFDVDELLARVREIAEFVGEANDTAWDALDTDQQVQAKEFVARNVDRALQTS